jgi:choline monooxygenase
VEILWRLAGSGDIIGGVQLDAAADALARGRTLPARWYADPDVLAVERERIFRRSWQYAGRADELEQPGAYLTTDAGGLPLVVVRDREGVLRAHVNVCRHRGHHLVTGSGSCSTLQCPYHAWTYDLDGRLRQAPRAGAEDLDLRGIALHPAAVDTWGPFVFVHADPQAPSLHEQLGDLPDVLAGVVDLTALRHRERTEWTLECNWKVAVENYLECYHCQVAHPGLSKLVDVRPEAYALHERDTFSFQIGSARNGGIAGDDVPHAQWHWLWPNVAINVEPGALNLSIDRWTPDGPGRTHGVTDYFFGADVPADAAAEIVAFSRQVGAEDQDLVESVQRGLASGALDAGLVMPRSERLVAHFERLVLDALRA